MSTTPDLLTTASLRRYPPSTPRTRIASFLRRPATFWCLLAALCLVRGYVGLYGTRSYSHDAFMVLDGAWRMLNGQRPHVDFNSMVGPVAYLPTLVGLLLTGGSAAGFGWGQSLAAFGLGCWAYALGSGLSAPARSLFALCTAAVAVSPALIGPTPLDIAPGMTYNRLSYALLSLLLLDGLEERGPSMRARSISNGCVLGLLLFLKMTAFAAGILTVLAFMLLRRHTWRTVAATAFAFLAVTAAFLAYLHGRVDLVLQDLALTAAAKRIAFGTLYLYSAIFFEASIALVFTLGAARWHERHGDSKTARQVRLAGLFVVALSCLLLFGNYQHSELPLFSFFTIVILDAIASRHPKAQQDPSLPMLAQVRTIYVALMLGAVMVALVTGVRARLYTVRYAHHLASSALDAFVPVASDYEYVTFVNDGLHMLERDRLPGEHVMSLDFTNPFSFGLHIPPAAGGTTNLQFHGSFDAEHKVPAQRLFGASELVMLPVQPSDYSLTFSLGEIYGPYLQEHYHVVDHDRIWTLFRRNAP